MHQGLSEPNKVCGDSCMALADASARKGPIFIYGTPWKNARRDGGLSISILILFKMDLRSESERGPSQEWNGFRRSFDLRLHPRSLWF